MLKYAGGAVCPRCRSSLVHEYDCFGDCLPFDALTQVEQRLICPVCGYTRHVAYVVERQKREARR
jgi:transposase-like protein